MKKVIGGLYLVHRLAESLQDPFSFMFGLAFPAKSHRFHEISLATIRLNPEINPRRSPPIGFGMNRSSAFLAQQLMQRQFKNRSMKWNRILGSKSPPKLLFMFDWVLREPAFENFPDSTAANPARAVQEVQYALGMPDR